MQRLIKPYMGDIIVTVAVASLLLLLVPLLMHIDPASCQMTKEYDWFQTECPPTDAQMMVNRVPWGVQGRAYLPLPKGLRIAPSKIKGAGFGVISDTFIQKYTWLGEYDGETIPLKFSQQISRYARQVRRSLEIVAYTDGYHLHLSSYHRYINSPNRHVDANVITLECYGKVYHLTVKAVAPGEELLVFYGPSYSLDMNIDLNEYFDTAKQLLAIGFDMNNQTHRDWVNNAGFELYEMRNPPPSFLSIFLKNNSAL